MIYPNILCFFMLQSKSSSILIFTSTSSLHFSQFPSGLYGHKQVILTPLGLARPRYLVSQRAFSGAGSHKKCFCVFAFFFFNRAIYIVGYEFWMEHISSPTAATWNVYRITHIGAWFLSSSMNAIDDGMSDPKTTRKFGKFQFANGNVWDTYGNNAIYHLYYFQFVN